MLFLFFRYIQISYVCNYFFLLLLIFKFLIFLIFFSYSRFFFVFVYFFVFFLFFFSTFFCWVCIYNHTPILLFTLLSISTLITSSLLNNCGRNKRVCLIILGKHGGIINKIVVFFTNIKT